MTNTNTTRSLQLSPSAGETFYYPTTSPSTVYVTLSLCAAPRSLSSSLPSSLPSVLFLSNSSSLSAPGPSTFGPVRDKAFASAAILERGFANATMLASSGAWIGVWAPSGGATSERWNFELDVSTTAPVVGVSASAGLAFDGADAASALLTTGNYSLAGSDATSPAYTAVVVPSTGMTSALDKSMCFVRNQTSARVAATVTTRGWSGGQRVQYDVGGLAKGTNYTAWILEPQGATMMLSQPVSFVTQTGPNCRLVHSLDFCPQVAYAVPAPVGVPTQSLVAFYNATLAPSLANFARSLSLFPCNDSSMGAYSHVSTCDDCLSSYTTWLCATTLPRCADAPSNTTLALSQSDASWPLPPSYEQILVRSSPLASRTPLFAPTNLSSLFPNGTTPFPYAEVPPCLDVCNLVGARCPPMFSWGCPTTGPGGTGTAGYGQTRVVHEGARMAGDPGGGGGLRGGDRFGNVFCNALETDLLVALQQPRVASASAVYPSLLAILALLTATSLLIS